MAVIRCRNCGLQEWTVPDVDGTSYLKCTHCGKTTTVAITTKNNRMQINTY